MHAMPPSLEKPHDISTGAAGVVGSPSGPLRIPTHTSTHAHALNHSLIATPQCEGRLRCAVRGTVYATHVASSADPPRASNQKIPRIARVKCLLGMENLDQVLEAYVATEGENASSGRLLGASFVVVTKDGMTIDNVYSSLAWTLCLGLWTDESVRRGDISGGLRAHSLRRGICQVLRRLLHLDCVHDQDRDGGGCHAAHREGVHRTRRRCQTPRASFGRDADPPGLCWRRYTVPRGEYSPHHSKVPT